VRWDAVAAAGSLQVFPATHPYLGGAPAAAAAQLSDTRRGINPATPNNLNVLNLQGSASAANVAAASFLEFLPADTNTEAYLMLARFLETLTVVPGVDLVFRVSVAAQALRLGVVWTEEPIAQATRGATG
jgi:hypothetical protein